MKVTEEDVKKMAELSMFYIEESKTEEFRRNLEAILQHVEKLNELDTSDIEANAYILNQQNIFREDVPCEYGHTEELLSNAPLKEEGSFVVPKVME